MSVKSHVNVTIHSLHNALSVRKRLCGAGWRTGGPWFPPGSARFPSTVMPANQKEGWFTGLSDNCSVIISLLKETPSFVWSDYPLTSCCSLLKDSIDSPILHKIVPVPLTCFRSGNIVSLALKWRKNYPSLVHWSLRGFSLYWTGTSASLLFQWLSLVLCVLSTDDIYKNTVPRIRIKT